MLSVEAIFHYQDSLVALEGAQSCKSPGRPAECDYVSNEAMVLGVT